MTFSNEVESIFLTAVTMSPVLIVAYWYFFSE